MYVCLYVCMYVKDVGASGLRWSVVNFHSKDDLEKLQTRLEAIIDCYPTLQESEYATLASLVKDFFLPNVKQS